MFLIALDVLFSIFVIALLIYLSNLKERFPELTQAGWNKLSSGLVFFILSGLTGLLSLLPLGSLIFSSVNVSHFLQIAFLALGISWLLWGLSLWLKVMRAKKEEVDSQHRELDYIRLALSDSQKGNTLIEIFDSFLQNTTTHFQTEQAAVWVINPSAAELILASYRGLSP